MWDVNAIVHTFIATELGRERVASPTLVRLYTGKVLALILQEAEYAPGPV